MTTALVEIRDLNDVRARTRFDEFIRLYRDAFDGEEYAEDPRLWRGRLSDARPESPEPVFHVVLATRTEDGAVPEVVVGGIVFEYYQQSQCGLLTYVVVAPSRRGQGLGRMLLTKAGAILSNDAQQDGAVLRAIFGEIHDPRACEANSDSMGTAERCALFHHLDARWLDIPYVQPPLGPGKGFVKNLLLYAFPLPDAGESDLRPEAIVAFLGEFYRALGIPEPESSDEYRQMTDALNKPGFLKQAPLVEQAQLSMERAAIALHFVLLSEGQPIPFSPPPADCPYFASFERDLLSHAFQIDPPFHSRCLLPKPLALNIHFPASVTFTSESRTETLFCPEVVRGARVSLSSTRFQESGVEILHLVLTPGKNGAFSEYDLIKLIHSYAGREENTGVAASLRFSIGDGREMSAQELLQRLHPSADRVPEHPSSGTVEVCTDSMETPGIAWEKLFGLLQDARGGAKAARAELGALYENNPAVRDALNACCGLVCGVFDFGRMSLGELLDALEPNVPLSGELMRLHRATVAELVPGDDLLADVWNTISISPYLIIPHAVLLHNEALVSRARGEIADGHHAGTLNLQDTACARAERLLNLQVPNVFQYSTERSLIAAGIQLRGASEQGESARRELAELGSRIQSSRQASQNRAGRWLANIAAIFTVVGSRDLVFDGLQALDLSRWAWPAFGGELLLVTALMAILNAQASKE